MNSRSVRLSRFLLDMHVPDWDKRFLSEFEPEEFCDRVASTGVRSAMVYAQSHVGLAYWPATTGTRHPAAMNRDLFGETVRGLRGRGLEVTAYYSVVFNNDASEKHPDWQLKGCAPLTFGPLPGLRYGLVCPNNDGYRDFARGQIRELVSGYEIDGLFTDMAFWPTVCLCDSCRRRSRDEMGADVPEQVNWDDPAWCAFQRTRERWLVEFTDSMRSAAWEIQPELPVYHNSAVIVGHWARGYSFDMANLSTFLGGDFYGGPGEQALISRLLTLMSRSRPAEFMTTMRAHLTHHEGLRSADQLEMIALASLAAGAAIRFIDAVDPVGTTNAAAYKMLEPILATVNRYEELIGGEPVSDVGVYVSDYSRVPWREAGSLAIEAAAPATTDHVRAAAGAVSILAAAGVPVIVVTRMNLGYLANLSVLVVPDARYLSDHELEAIRSFVGRGGRLYVSGYTGFGSELGVRPVWALEEITGCVVAGKTEAPIVYAVPVTASAQAALAPDRAATLRSAAADAGCLPRISGVQDDAVVEATLGFAYHDGVNRLDPGHWASIHSDPLWITSDEPAIVRRSYGRGEVVYSVSALEAGESSGQRLFARLVESLMPARRIASVDGPPWLSVSIFHQPGRSRYVVTLLAYPSDLPVQPVCEVGCTFHLPGKTVSGILVEETDESLHFKVENGTVATTVPVVNKLAVLTIQYETR